MLLKYFVNDELLLIETNIVNAGENPISIKDIDGVEVDVIHTFNSILVKYLKKSIFNNRTTSEVEQWFTSNFYKWIKRGAPDHANDMMDEGKFRQMFYVSLETYIKELLLHEKELVKAKKLSSEIILKSFPEFVQKNPKDAVVFSGGRLFRLKKLTPAIEKLHEFLITVVQNSKQRDDDIMPPTFMVKRLDTLDVPEAFKRTIAWHEYTIQQAEKVDAAKALQLTKTLKVNKDYKIIDNELDNAFMVQLMSAKAAKVEGTIMKHCVASYGTDIEKGKTTIYSLRNPQGVPEATIEIVGKNARQVKGRHNSTVKPEYHNALRIFFKKHNMSVGSDARNFGGMKQQ